MGRLRVGFVICALLIPGQALAAELAWRAPESCARAEAVKEQVGKLVGQRLSTIEGIDFEIEIEVQPDGRHVLLLRTLPRAAGDAPGTPRERTLDGASCAEVSDAASVAMALTIAEREEERSREQAAPLPAPEASAAEPADDAEEDAPTALHVSVGAGALLESGALPAVAIGAQLEAALGYGALRVGLVGALFAAQSGERAGDDSGARFDFVLGGMVVCGESGAAPALHLIACAGMEIGRLAAEGMKVSRSRSGDAAWYAPRADVGAFYALTSSLRAGLRAGVAVPLARPEFVLNGDDRVHKPANVSARLLIGLELRL